LRCDLPSRPRFHVKHQPSNIQTFWKGGELNVA